MKRMLFLDLLRIFSFMSVLIGHLFYDHLIYFVNNDALHSSLRFLISLIIPFCVGGGAGVVVFFLISGYVIIHVLQSEKPLEFGIKRIFRIYPLYILAVLIQYSLNHQPVQLHVLIPQLLLIGDFFQVSHTLNGVEWTLRVEVLFYLFMLILRHTDFIGKRENFLPWILVGFTLIIGNLAPIPGEGFWNKGYLNIYGPFLFLGVFIWLYENKKIGLMKLSAFVGLIYFQHWHLIDTVAPAWRNMNFAGLSFLLFLSLWIAREKLALLSSTLLIFISELTYAVYLFHNWLYFYFRQLLINKGLSHPSLLALILLFSICALLVKIIEKPGIKLGRNLVQYVKKHNQSIKGSFINRLKLFSKFSIKT